MPRRVPVALGLIAVLLAAASAGASPDARSARASARAFALKLVIPGQSDVLAAAVASPPDAVAFGGGFLYPADGSAVSTASLTAGASAGVRPATALASSDVTSLSLFRGEITADGVSARAKAAAGARDASGDSSGTRLANLVVLGQPVEASPGLRVPLADWGYVTLLDQGVVPSAAPGTQGYRGFVTALDVHLSADHGGLPAGSEILVGFAEAAAQAAEPPPPPASSPAAPRTSTGQSAGSTIGPFSERTGAGVESWPSEPTRALPGIPVPVIRPPPLDITPELTAGGYVFPVYGPSSFSDTFGAPRADVTYHHGDDIFAPLGAPVLAVASGTVFAVGWNEIGGNRLWLRDGQGNELYYAHLSAFTPLAVNGAHVKAGDVLGFVGNSGDAMGTPYHLHFEIHPVSLLVLGYDGAVDPTSYLTAWQHLQDVSFTAAPGWAPPAEASSRAPEPGAILLQASDISTASGLDPGSLQRALVAPVSAEGDGALVRALALAVADR